MSGRAGAAVLLLGVALLGPAAARAQDLAARIAPDGVTTFDVRTRPGVQVCEDGIVMHETRGAWRHDREGHRCVEGRARVRVEAAAGRIVDVEVEVPTDRAATLAEVGSEESTDYLLGLARSAPRRAAEDAIGAAALVDGVVIWPELLSLAKDRELSTDVRESAVFWLGQEAAEAVTEELSDLAVLDEDAQDVREAAVFALSQRDPSVSVPALIDLARSAPHAGTRRAAVFWLAQSEDERALAFFEEVLLGG